MMATMVMAMVTTCVMATATRWWATNRAMAIAIRAMTTVMKRAMARAARVMGTATKRAMGTDGEGNGNGNKEGNGNGQRGQWS